VILGDSLSHIVGTWNRRLEPDDNPKLYVNWTEVREKSLLAICLMRKKKVPRLERV
jgi:hypothetical protein